MMRTCCEYDAIPHFVRLYKFTGKERDAESGLDYFGARYYASNMGKWMSPDWSASAQPVPYAKLDNPQSLNLYAYVDNNPLGRADIDGHSWYNPHQFWNKLGNKLFTDADCWCSGEAALAATGRNRLKNAMADLERQASMERFRNSPQGRFWVSIQEVATFGTVANVAEKAILDEIEGAEAGDVFPGLTSAEPIGSALKTDEYHYAAFWARQLAAKSGTVFNIVGGDGKPATLIQVAGELNGTAGRFEYIVNSAGKLTHEMFVQGGTINGVPIKP